MDNPTNEEAIYMVRIKRKRAKEVMAKIIHRFGVISNEPTPGLEVLNDYFVNMVYGIELLLKVLADDWKTPGKSVYKHKIGEMYEAVFHRQHSDGGFVRELETAILDQKFLCEPAKGLMNRVEAIESLWDELVQEYKNRSQGKVNHVHKEVRADPAFGLYLAKHVDRFIDPKTHTVEVMSKEQNLGLKRLHIQHLEREIQQLSNAQEAGITPDELLLKLEHEYLSLLSSLARNMEHNFQMWGTSELRFSIQRLMMASVDLDH